MNSYRTSKEIIREWCEKNMSTHTDWTGTRVDDFWLKIKIKSIIARTLRLALQNPELAQEYPELELVYRQWSDGTIENGIIEKENWCI